LSKRALPSVALLLACVPAAAADRADGGRRLRLDASLGRLEARERRILIEPTVRLEQVRPDELLPDGRRSAISMGSYTRSVAPLASGSMNLGIVRHVPVVWRMYVPDERLLDSLEVRVQMISADGSPGCLSAGDDSRSVIRAVASSTPPVVVERDGEGAVVEGGLTLLLDLEEIRSAGTYTGTLTVTIDNF
jgi:hypothetical protein